MEDPANEPDDEDVSIGAEEDEDGDEEEDNYWGVRAPPVNPPPQPPQATASPGTPANQANQANPVTPPPTAPTAPPANPPPSPPPHTPAPPIVINFQEDEENTPMPTETFIRDFFSKIELQLSEITLNFSKQIAEQASRDARAITEVNSSIIQATQHISDLTQYGLLDATYITQAHTILNPAQSNHCNAINIPGESELVDFFVAAHSIDNPGDAIMQLDCRRGTNFAASFRGTATANSKYMMVHVCESHRKDVLLLRGFDMVNHIKMLVPAQFSDEDPDVLMHVFLLRRGV